MLAERISSDKHDLNALAGFSTKDGGKAMRRHIKTEAPLEILRAKDALG